MAGIPQTVYARDGDAHLAYQIVANRGPDLLFVPTATFPTGSGTFSFTNRSMTGLTGDASGTWTLCVVDTDAFGDTGTLNTWSVHD